jgi:hypothetical protein
MAIRDSPTLFSLLVINVIWFHRCHADANIKTGTCEDYVEVTSENGDVDYRLCGKSKSVRLLATNSTRITIRFKTGGWETATGAFLYFRGVYINFTVSGTWFKAGY